MKIFPWGVCFWISSKLILCFGLGPFSLYWCIVQSFDFILLFKNNKSFSPVFNIQYAKVGAVRKVGGTMTSSAGQWCSVTLRKWTLWFWIFWWNFLYLWKILNKSSNFQVIILPLLCLTALWICECPLLNFLKFAFMFSSEIYPIICLIPVIISLFSHIFKSTNCAFSSKWNCEGNWRGIVCAWAIPWKNGHFQKIDCWLNWHHEILPTVQVIQMDYQNEWLCWHLKAYKCIYEEYSQSCDTFDGVCQVYL